MIAAILTISGLILYLSEKPHLLKKPYGFGKILLVIVLLSSAIVSVVKAHIDDNQQDTDSRTIASLNGEAKALNGQISTLRKENKIAANECSAKQIGIIELLAKYSLQVDGLKDTIISLRNKVNNEVPPTLTIIDKPIIYIRDTVGIRFVDLTFDLSAFGANAHVTDAYYVLIKVKDNKLSDSPIVNIFHSINYSQVIPVGQPLSVYLPIPYLNDISKYDYVIAMNFDYKSKGNNDQTPLRKAFVISSFPRYSITPVNNIQFADIGRYLKKNKIWTKIYKL
jgi:hypothetical protein